MCESTIKKSPHKPAILSKDNSFESTTDSKSLNVTLEEDKDEELPFNIIISNVTSIAPELFDSDPRVDEVPSSIKRTLDDTEFNETNEQVKRARLEDTFQPPADSLVGQSLKNVPTTPETVDLESNVSF